MFARTWRGRAAAETADHYHRHFMTDVVANLRSIPGHKGAFLLRRPVGGEVEYLAVTLWDSVDTIRSFTGDNIDVAHI